MKSLNELIIEAGYDEKYVPFLETVAKLINYCAEDVAPYVDFLLKEKDLKPSSIEESVKTAEDVRDVLVNGVFTFLSEDLQNKLTSVAAFLGEATSIYRRYIATGIPFSDVTTSLTRGLGTAYCLTLVLAETYKSDFEKIKEDSILEAIDEILDYKYLAENEEFLKCTAIDYATEYKKVEFIDDNDDSDEEDDGQVVTDLPELEFGNFEEDEI